MPKIVAATGSIKAVSQQTPQFFIGMDGDVCGAGAPALGVVSALADTGDMCPVDISGILEVISGGSFSVGDPIRSDASGQAVKASALAAALTLEGTLAAGSTAVTSTSANPTPGVTGTAALTGGALPVVVLGYAMDASTGSGQLVRIKVL